MTPKKLEAPDTLLRPTECSQTPESPTTTTTRLRRRNSFTEGEYTQFFSFDTEEEEVEYITREFPITPFKLSPATVKARTMTTPARTSANTNTTNVPQENGKGPAVSPPKPFTGDRTKTKEFIFQTNLYINAKKKDFKDSNGNEDDEIKITFMLSYMKDGPAVKWAQQYSEQLPFNKTGAATAPEKYKAEDFNNFVRMFEERFKQFHKEDIVRRRLEYLKQGKSSVDTYNDEFNNLAADTQYDENALRYMYLQGLNQRIQDQINLMSMLPKTIYECQDKAVEFDVRYLYGPGGDNRRTEYTAGTKSNPIEINYTKLTDTEREEYREQNKCFKCGKIGHMARFCRSRQGQQNNNFRGRGRGHFTYNQGRNSNNMKARIGDLLQNATAEELNEMSMAIKEVIPADIEKEDF